MRYLKHIIAGLLVLLYISGPSFAVAQPKQEYKVKAAFIVNFARFTKWPADAFESAGQPISICLAGDDPFGEAFSGVEGQKIHGRKITLKRYSSLLDVEQCQMIFIHSSEKDRIKSFNQQQNKSILTVSDIDGFVSIGGMIELVRVNNKFSFQINNSLVKQQNLKIDASLLGLAKEVY